jgi:hypothetical protein
LIISAIDIRDTLQAIDEQLYEKMRIIEQSLKPSYELQKVVDALCDLAEFSKELPRTFSTIVSETVDKILHEYLAIKGFLELGILGAALYGNENGALLVDTHPLLASEFAKRRRQKTQNQDNVEYVVEKLEGAFLTPKAKQSLKSKYEDFSREYESLLTQVLQSMADEEKKRLTADEMVANIRSTVAGCSIVQRSRSGGKELKITSEMTSRIPKLLAQVSSLWTLLYTKGYNEALGRSKSNAELFRPHVAQIFCIMRILGIGYDQDVKEDNSWFGGMLSSLTGIFKDLAGYKPVVERIQKLRNNLVEVGTGEGKSVILGFTAAIMALLGMEVDVSCYSDYLSQRDKNDMKLLFDTLHITEFIHYGTFGKLCEGILDEKMSMRKTVEHMITKNLSSPEMIRPENARSEENIRPKVLLIDEVDVFLSDEFYGAKYYPAFLLKSSEIYNLQNAIWNTNKRTKIRQLKIVTNLPEFKVCETKYSHYRQLFIEAVKDMLSCLNSYESKSQVFADREKDALCEVDLDGASSSVLRGYNTVWNYFKFHELGQISFESLKKNTGLIVNCGAFSFAEMPLEFSFITGVSGTLRTLAPAEKAILTKIYGIEAYTYMPSVFMARADKFKVGLMEYRNSQDFDLKIKEAIDFSVRGERAVLVVFENAQKLHQFESKDFMEDLKLMGVVQTLDEKNTPYERDQIVKKSTSIRQVTLMTRRFGRGTDFICRNEQVIRNGGVHVIQTFFSPEKSEEVQIQGRTARQGDPGTWQLIALDKELEMLVGPQWESELPRLFGSSDGLYNSLSKKRDELYNKKCESKTVGIQNCKADHEASKAFMKAVIDKNQEDFIRYLLLFNRGVDAFQEISRTLLLVRTSSIIIITEYI